jgi:putative peptidoglycan lipid II flippase
VWLSVEDECWYLPYAVLAAGLLQCALMLWMVRRTGPLPPLTTATSPELVELRRALIPTLFASGVFQINSWIGTMLALLLVPGHGAVQFLYFGNRLLQFPLALIGHGVTTAAYPELARAAGQGWGATGEGLRAAARLQAFWLLPAAVGLLVCAEPLVRTIYQVGAFGPEAIARTVLVAQMLALALVPVSLGKLLVRAFHAHRDQRTPMRVSLGMVGCNLVLNLILVRTPLQEAGLALATALSSAGGMVVYLVILDRRGAGLVLDLRGLLRPALAALVMGGAVAYLLHSWPQPEGRASGYAALRLAAAVALGMLVYVGITGRAWLRRRRGQTAPTPAEESL